MTDSIKDLKGMLRKPLKPVSIEDMAPVNIIDVGVNQKRRAEKLRSAISPGKILLDEFMKPERVTVEQLSAGTGLSAQDIRDILQDVQPITEDSAQRLDRFFRTEANFWLNLQREYNGRFLS